MPRRKAPLQVNRFSKGLYTEINPLETDLETTSDEINMELDLDGSRRKRLGFDLESGYTPINTAVTYDNTKILGNSVFRWENAGGNPDKILLVVQVGHSLKFFDLDNSIVSSEELFSVSFPSSTYDKTFSYATVDSLLVVCTGEKDVYTFEYREDGDLVVFTQSTETLYIRDLFGVQAFSGSTDLTLSQNQQIRPRTDTVTSEHIYNLRNQGWHRSLRQKNTENVKDVIQSFRQETPVGMDDYWPSNSDQLNRFIYPDANDSDNRLVDRFFADNMYETQPNNVSSPQGHFIIDALDRGTSRLEQEQSLRDRDSLIIYTVPTLPTDRTPGGASVITEHSGRVWFGGFSGIVEGGDSKSPRMSSYILFSTLVKDRTDVGRCYQEADPTDGEDSAIVDTDGGFIRVQGAYGINKLISLGSSLFVFAENGVWRISGPDNSDFKATDYEVHRLTDRGCISGNSAVLAETAIFYWGDSGIYRISRNQFGEWVTSNLVENRIDTYYQEIPISNKNVASGFYDSFSKEVRWLHNKVNDEDPDDEYSYELVYNTALQAFTPNKVVANLDGNIPKLINVFETNPYTASAQTFDVVDNAGNIVTTGSDIPVTVSLQIRSGFISTAFYLVVTSISGVITYSFGSYNDTTYLDWDNVGVAQNYDAYLITNSFVLGEPRSKKQVPYLTTFFKRTEAGFDNELVPINESSCLVSARFNWSDNIASNKWSTDRQAYRYNRTYIPSNSSDPFETGAELIVTRNKLRGSGNSVAFRLAGEQGKNLHIYGWGFNLFASNED